MARNLILIRHGAVEERYAGKLVGSTDAALSPAGIEQARRAGQYLADTAPASPYFISSPKKRCIETAAAAGVQSGAMAFDEDLREADFGDWEGLAYSEIARRDPEGAGRWAMFEPGFSFPGGEGLSDFIERVGRVADRMSASEHETVVAFTHGGVIRFMLCRLLGLDFRKYVIFDIKYADVVVLKLYEGKAVLSAIVNHE